MSAQNPAVIEGAKEPRPAEVLLVYPSWTMKNALASLVNLVTLLIGIAIGVVLAPHIEHRAGAEAVPAQVPATPGTQVQPPAPQGNVEQIQPVMSAGSIGSYLLLAHHIQSDELVVNGYDLLKLQNAQLQLLSHLVPAYEIQSAVNSAKADHLYQVAAPNTPAALNGKVK